MSDETEERRLCEQNDDKCTKCPKAGCNDEPKSAGISSFEIQNQLLIKICAVYFGLIVFIYR